MTSYCKCMSRGKVAELALMVFDLIMNVFHVNGNLSFRKISVVTMGTLVVFYLKMNSLDVIRQIFLFYCSKMTQVAANVFYLSMEMLPMALQVSIVER